MRSQTRTDAITTNTPKKAASTGKPERPTSGGTSNSSDSAMTGILSNQGKPHLEPMKVIKEVDGNEMMVETPEIGVFFFLFLSQKPTLMKS